MKPAPLPAPHILLIDDNRDGLLVRRALLEEVGYSVEVARSAEEGLRLYESSAFDIVVSDYRMPRMDGTELIQRIRQVNPNARIILLSGFVETLGLTEENTGADAVLVKSAKEAVNLLRAVKRLLARTRQRKPPAVQTGARPGSRIRAVSR